MLQESFYPLSECPETVPHVWKHSSFVKIMSLEMSYSLCIHLFVISSMLLITYLFYLVSSYSKLVIQLSIFLDISNYLVMYFSAGSLCNCLLPEALKITAVQHDPVPQTKDGERRKLRSAFSCLSSISMRQKRFSAASLLSPPFRSAFHIGS